ncbi:unnamed protein product [Notodromas monacha]|uniref:Uncharacterized protein n=1 Tax=Notodromas monacha TaxID=399045 RepID=A0A7R9BET9_9CRUS|nr:unnamed protein product [Notodromas monacha]CAG0913996.1 unnamed protein product [Notodromas monacha]
MLFRKEKVDDKALPLEKNSDHDKSITCMALSDDQSLLVSGSDDGTARMYSAKTTSMECLGVFRGHTDYITCIAIFDTHVITGSADCSVRKWDMASCECLDVYQGHASRIFSIICSGNVIVSSSYDKSARAWRFDTSDLDDDEDPCLRTFVGHTKAVLSLAFFHGANSGYDSDEDSPGDFSEKLITGSADGTAKSWFLKSPNCVKTFKGHTGPISSIAVDEEAAILFTASMDKTVRSWDVHLGRCLKVQVLLSGKFVQVFTGCGDKSLRAFDAKSGALRRTYKGHEAGITAMAYVGGFIISGGFDGTLIKWSTADLV